MLEKGGGAAVGHRGIKGEMFERSTPEAQGVSSAGIVGFIRTLDEKHLHIHSFRFLRHDKVIAESFYAPYRPENLHMLFSLSKSFTSTAVGFAVKEGLIRLSDPLLSFFEGKLKGEPCENMKKITVKHLLTMNTGHETEPQTTDNSPESDWVRFFLESYVPDEPGTHFLYNTFGTYMLSAIVEKATGMSLLEYLRPRLFEPLGLSEDAWWEKSPQGISTGGYGLNLRLDDLMRFGTLYLHRGNWEGRQILPEAWVDEASSFWSDNGAGVAPENKGDWNMGYGYQFWRCKPEGVYRGDGAFGQYCIIMPKQDMVFVANSGLDDMGAVMQAIWDHVLPAVSGEGALPEADGETQKTLAALTCGRALETAALAKGIHTPYSVPEDASYRISGNPLGILHVTFKKETNEAVFSTQDRKLCVPLSTEWKDCSWSGPSPQEHNSLEKLASRAFGANGRLYLTLAFTEAPFVEEMEFAFTSHGLEGRLKQNVGFADQDAEMIGYRTEE